MRISAPQPATRSLNPSDLPARVYTLCDGLLKVGAVFFERQLKLLLNDLEDVLFKNAEHGRPDADDADGFSALRDLKRTRHDFIPRFLAAVESQLAGIRQTETGSSPTAAQILPFGAELRLLDDDSLDLDQIHQSISARCESQNSFDIFLLAQRIGVLAGKPAFGNEQMPLGPRALCRCLQQAIECLGLGPNNSRQIYYLFERHVFGHFDELMKISNQYLSEHGVLPNLSYVPFRNPELRFKKTPIALGESKEPDAASSKIYSLFPDGAPPKGQAQAMAVPANVDVEESFSKLQNLLAKRKQLLNQLSSLTNTYLSDAGDAAGRAVPADADQLRGILDEFQRQALAQPNAYADISHLKHDLLAQLRNQSTPGQELTLGAEDSDAIDLVGLLMDDAMKEVSPNSPTGQLIGMMQTPLIRVVLRDKSFFSNQVHPARQMLNILAEAGINWLDGSDKDDPLHGNLTGIVSNTVKDFDGDSEKLLTAYEETNQLLQSLIKKAEAVERRQIEVAKVKEKLRVARTRAESVMAELMAVHEIPMYTKSVLNEAWVDVMALTELRNGPDSSNWQEQCRIAERIIAANDPDAGIMADHGAEELMQRIRDSLAMVGYHEDEAAHIAERLLQRHHDEPAAHGRVRADKTRFGDSAKGSDLESFQLDEQQMALVEELKEVPVGTWFEFLTPGSSSPTRAKLTWLSKITHNCLFVTQRGIKHSEMLLEELAIAISEGRARIQPGGQRNIFERAFENMLTSLRAFMPGGDKDA